MKTNKPSLSVTHPELARQWHASNLFGPDAIRKGSNKKVYWQCDKFPDHIFLGRIADRVNKKTGCTFCAKTNRRPTSQNCLAVTHPQLASQWDLEKNSHTPNDVLAGSCKKVHWKCDKGEDHKWMATPANRSNFNQGCPYCSGKKPCKYNNLSTTHPELSAEWSSDNILKAQEVVPGTHFKAWWVCTICQSKWIAKVNNRTSSMKSGCPACAESKGEKSVRDSLEATPIKYTREQILDGCGDKSSFFFDFVLWNDDKIVAAIEYHGAQHYRPVEFFGGEESLKRTKERDAIKRNYCRIHNIPLLEIPYTELPNISSIIKDFLEGICILKN